MTTEDFKRLMVEYALTNIRAESLFFKQFYQTDCIEVEYEMLGDYGVAYLIEGDERSVMVTVHWEDVAGIMQNISHYTGAIYNQLIKKYNLESNVQPLVITPEEVQEAIQELKLESEEK